MVKTDVPMLLVTLAGVLATFLGAAASWHQATQAQEANSTAQLALEETKKICISTRENIETILAEVKTLGDALSVVNSQVYKEASQQSTKDAAVEIAKKKIEPASKEIGATLASLQECK